MDHFMPYCGVRVANEFYHVIRDAINHSDAAFLFIGYNHTGKKACTAGELGKHLFNSSNDIFSLSTVREVTTVRHISGYDLRVLPDDSQFHFTIGPDNLPHEVAKPTAKPASGIDDDTLRHIVEDIIQETDQGSQERKEGQGSASAITPSNLISMVKARHAQLKRDTRDAAILDQIHRLRLLPQDGNQSAPQGSPEGSNNGTSHTTTPGTAATSHPTVSAVKVNGDGIAVKSTATTPSHDAPHKTKELTLF